MNRPVTSTKIESMTQKLPTNKNPGTDGFTRIVYQTFREELIPILLKLFQKLQRKEHFQAHSMHHHSDIKTRQRTQVLMRMQRKGNPCELLVGM